MRRLKFVKVVLLALLVALLVVGSGKKIAQVPVSEIYVIQAGSGEGNYRALVQAVT